MTKSFRLAAAFFVVLNASTGFLPAALIGNNFEISGPNCLWPDAAYGTVSKQYLVVWADYNYSPPHIFGRLVTDAGVPSGAVFQVSESSSGGLLPAVAYNAVNNEFLVTWDDYDRPGHDNDVIYGQRVRASDGVLMGTNFPIGSVPGIRSAVAWSPVNNVFLVLYWGIIGGVNDIFGQRVASSGALLGTNFNISNDGSFSGLPAVAWGASGNQFLVSWDNDDGNIHGQRVGAATGALLGSPIIVTTGGAKDRSCVAYDSVSNRWLVQFNDQANAGFSYDQYGQLINPDGTLSGDPIPLAHTPGFEGDTQLGGDVAFVPGARRFFSSFALNTGMGGQESLATGEPVGPQVVLGTGNYTSLNNAADPLRNRFLTTWQVQFGVPIVGQLYGVTVNPVTNFTAAGQNLQVALSWLNPNDVHFTGTMIRYRTDAYPASPEDGTMVVDKLNAAGSNDAFAHTSLTNWTTYYYSAFAHDIGPNYSLVAQAAATPRPAVVTISSSEFTSDADGWTLETWQSGPGSPGTIAQDAATGSMVSTGNGESNNRDACLREGSIMTRAISTIGRSSIQVEYDVMTSLHSPPTGSPSGGCTVLEGSIEDKLVVYYSTAGTSGPWTVGQILSEGVELPTGWTRKLINLAGVSAVSNNADFALRFQWQFNSMNDTGRVDNVRVLSGAVTAPVPDIGLSTTSIERTVQAGQNLPSDILRVNNTGEGVLNFTVSENAPWLGASPTDGSSAGPEVTILLGYTTAGLGVGDYEATLQVASLNAVNSPQTVAVTLHVIPAVCFWEPFAYYDGDLTTFGSANWSGSATDEIQVESGVLKVLGGAGVVNAAHSVSCAGSNGVIVAQIKIKRGTGSGDFFWNIALDDASANNLARWYGGSTIARGRVGSTITAEMPLTSPTTWDDLYVKIDTAANTSTFFFNGVSFGSITHGATPANSVGSIRLERLDRFSAVGDTIYFDNLTVGSVDLTPPHLDSIRSGNTLILSWPATGTGAQLELAPTLSPPIQWSAVTNPLGLTNGHRTFATNVTSGSGFFRLMKQP